MVNLLVRIDGWLSEEGFHICIEEQEEIISFFKLANDFIDSQCVPSNPPTIRDTGRESILLLALKLESLVGYLRTQAYGIEEWEDSLGLRD